MSRPGSPVKAGGIAPAAQGDGTVWERVLAELSGDPSGECNTAFECCERLALDRGRLAMIVRHLDGGREPWTFYELDRQARRASTMFRNLGLAPGSAVAGLLGRGVETWITALGAWRAGLVYVPLFSGFGPEAIRTRLTAAGVTAVVVGSTSRDALKAAIESLPAPPAVFTVTGRNGIGLRRGDLSFWAELERVGHVLPAVPTNGSDVATIMFTSGTTGPPKGCLIPHSGFVAVMPFVAESLGLTRSDLLFSTADPGWTYGLYTCGLATMALGLPRLIDTAPFDPQRWLSLMSDEDVTALATAPSAVRRLVFRSGAA